MNADWLTIIVAIVAVVIAWKIFKGVVKTIALAAILIAAAVVVFGGFV